MKHRIHSPTLATMVLLSALASPAHAQPAATDASRQILDKAGVKGGLVVVLGSDSPDLLLGLRANESYIVQGLAPDPARADAVRAQLQKKVANGAVTIRSFAGERLPFIDNLVNLLAVADDCGVSAEEIRRVVTPGGAMVWLAGDGAIQRIEKKPRGPELGEWTHLLHGPNNNAVSTDTVLGHPTHANWVYGPEWARHHDKNASYAALVTANGRLFTIMDEAPRFSVGAADEWVLLAQDAFNGKVLWKRPIDWVAVGAKSGPAVLPRRLVAFGDLLYAVPGLDGPVEVIDAATGTTLAKLPDSDHASEILVDAKQVVITTAKSGENVGRGGKGAFFLPAIRSVKAYDREARRLSWQMETNLLPVTLAMDGARVYFHDSERVRAVDRATGKELWQAEPAPLDGPQWSSEYGPILLVEDGVVLYSMTAKLGKEFMAESPLHAYDAKTGETLWTGTQPPAGHRSAKDMFVINGLVWMPDTSLGDHRTIALDLKTGAKAKDFLPQVKPSFFHARCYRAKATPNFLITSLQGFELIDIEACKWHPYFWVRGACNIGFTPGNGMLYIPPTPCNCFTDTMLHGTYALASGGGFLDWLDAPGAEANRLERGPAAGTTPASAPAPTPGDWPTYRADAARSGAIGAGVPDPAAELWRAKIGGRISAPTIAGGRVFVSAIDRHTIHALDAATGKPRWMFTAGGRVDSPPTLHEGKAYFGCADGFVYCLDAESGGLLWRFRAAPSEAQMGARDQLESVWPVHGAVLIAGGKLHCVAGRSIYLAKGMRLVQLDPATGKLLNEVALDARDPATGEIAHYDGKEVGSGLPVGSPDILSSDGQRLYMRTQQFDMDGKAEFFRSYRGLDTWQHLMKLRNDPERHIFSVAGFLDDSFFHRHYWIYGKGAAYGSGAYYLAGRVYPAGRLLVRDGEHVFGFGTKPEFMGWGVAGGQQYELFRSGAKPEMVSVDYEAAKRKAGEKEAPARRAGKKADTNFNFVRDWTVDLPILARGLVKAGDAVFVAGLPELVKEPLTGSFGSWNKAIPDEATAKGMSASWRGASGGRLYRVGAKDGAIQKETPLDSPPVWDGMAAAQGRLYLSLMNGEVVCLGTP